MEFSAYAFNGDGVKSETHRMQYARELDGRGERGEAFVIVVGVNAYENRSWDLRYAANDARLGGEIVARRLEASGEFRAVHTASLIAERDGSGSVSGVATRASLMALLEVLAGGSGDVAVLGLVPGADAFRKATPDDLVYLAFSGHGMAGEDGRFYFFLSDIGEGTVRVVDDYVLGNALDSDALAEQLREVDAGSFVMVVDACNSAASVEGGGFKPGPMGSRGLGQLAYDKGMYVIAASQSEAVALESDRLRQGLLTYAMLREGLADGEADRAPTDGFVGFRELLSYGAERVPQLHREVVEGVVASDWRALVVDLEAGGTLGIQRPRFFDFAPEQDDLLLPLTRSGGR